MIIIKIVIMIIALKAQFEIVTIPSLRHELSQTRALNWPGRNCVQIMRYLEPLSRATCRAPRGTTSATA